MRVCRMGTVALTFCAVFSAPLFAGHHNTTYFAGVHIGTQSAFPATTGFATQAFVPQAFNTQAYYAPQAYSTQAFVTPHAFSTQAFVNPQAYSTQAFVNPQAYSTQAFVNPQAFSTQAYLVPHTFAVQTSNVSTQGLDAATLIRLILGIAGQVTNNPNLNPGTNVPSDLSQRLAAIDTKLASIEQKIDALKSGKKQVTNPPTGKGPGFTGAPFAVGSNTSLADAVKVWSNNYRASVNQATSMQADLREAIEALNKLLPPQQVVPQPMKPME